MKTFSAKSSAVRAAANHFKVGRNIAEISKVAVIRQAQNGDWFWEAICTGSPKKEGLGKTTKVKAQSTKVEPKASKKEAVDKKVVKRTKPSKGSWKRPGAGTKTGRVWELADEFQSRALVLEAAKQEGLNMAMASQQFFRWSHSAK